MVREWCTCLSVRSLVASNIIQTATVCDKKKCYKQRCYEQNRAEGEPIQCNESWRHKAPQ